MLTAYNHIRMSSVDKYGSVEIFYPETTAVDVLVKIDGNENIPQGVDNIQRLVNELAVSAFTNPISDEVTASTATWSSRKINSELETVNTTINNSVDTLSTAISNTNTELNSSISNVRSSLTNSINKVNVYVGEDELLHFVNAAGTDSALNFKKASGTATADQVLTGYTFSNSSGTNLPGSMVNNGAVTKTLSPGSSYTIPKGYHNGNGVITGGNNENTLTYTFASGSTGTTVDLGVSNSYRYVNAENVYSKGSSDGYNSGYNSGYSSGRSSGYSSGYSDGYYDGKAAGTTTHTGTLTLNNVGTIDMGSSHSYRYVNTGNLAMVYHKKTDVWDEDTISASLTGSHTVSGYTFKIVFCELGSIILIGTTSLGSYTWSEACGLTWTVSIGSNVLSSSAITVANCKIPKASHDLWYTVDYIEENMNVGIDYWYSTTFDSSRAYFQSKSGSSGSALKTSSLGVVPFVLIRTDILGWDEGWRS